VEYADFKIPVFSEDGDRIGTLARVDGPFMRVSRGWFRRDLYIPTEYITAATAREVIVGFPANDLPRFGRATHVPAPQPLGRREAA
jgi:hypothetical protein